MLGCSFLANNILRAEEAEAHTLQLKCTVSTREAELSQRITELAYSLDAVTKSSEDRIEVEVDRRRKVEKELARIRLDSARVLTIHTIPKEFTFARTLLCLTNEAVCRRLRRHVQFAWNH